MDVKVFVLFSFFLSILFRCCFNWFLILGHSEVSQGWCRIQKDFCFSIFSHTILLYDRFEVTTKKFDGHLVSWFFFISWSNHSVSGFFFLTMNTKCYARKIRVPWDKEENLDAVVEIQRVKGMNGNQKWMKDECLSRMFLKLHEKHCILWTRFGNKVDEQSVVGVGVADFFMSRPSITKRVICVESSLHKSMSCWERHVW